MFSDAPFTKEYSDLHETTSRSCCLLSHLHCSTSAVGWETLNGSTRFSVFMFITTVGIIFFLWKGCFFRCIWHTNSYENRKKCHKPIHNKRKRMIEWKACISLIFQWPRIQWAKYCRWNWAVRRNVFTEKGNGSQRQQAVTARNSPKFHLLGC